MADEVEHVHPHTAAAPGESVHLPGPSFLPVLVALFTTIMVVSVVVSWYLFAIAALIDLAIIVRWIKDTRREIAELPLEH
jgi:hypothetical protein